MAVSYTHLGEEGYVTELLHICKQEKIGLLIPRTEEDVFILSQRASEFEAVGTEVLIANEELALLCSNKRWTARFFEECGLNAPDVYKRQRLGCRSTRIRKCSSSWIFLRVRNPIWNRVCQERLCWKNFHQTRTE